MNAACVDHVNTTLSLDDNAPTQGTRVTVRLEKEVFPGEQALCFYGLNYRPDLFCHCGASLDSEGDPATIKHVSVVSEFCARGFNPYSTGDHVSALHDEAAFYEAELDRMDRIENEQEKVGHKRQPTME